MILVTGGAGFIGGNYLYKLYEQDPSQKVLCVDNLTYASNYNYIKPLIDKGFVQLEVRDISSEVYTDYIFKAFNPEYVVHFAAESHVDNSINDFNPFIKTNIIGTANLLKSALAVPSLKKFVHVSTDEVYGSLALDDLRSFTETSPIETNSPYSASKAASDNFVRAFYKTYGLPAVITNCSNNYGPNQHREKFIPTILNSIFNEKNIPVYGNGENVRDWLYVEDHCDALNLVLEKGVPGEKYNIGGGEEISNLDLVKKILSKLGKDEMYIDFVKDRPGHDLRYSIDCSKITTELGYKAKYTLDQGLSKTIEWYQKNV
jgi:dTDP-glucose 4,6-dehydratase